MDGTVADDRTDCTGVDWIVEAGTDDDEDGTEDGTNLGEERGADEVGTGGLEMELDGPQAGDSLRPCDPAACSAGTDPRKGSSEAGDRIHDR